MGNIVGGLIGGVGSLLGGSSAKSNDLTGYNYLANGGGAPTINAAQTAGQTADSTVSNTQGLESGLLTPGANTPQAQSAFNNYLNSAGYQFQLGQGTSAINQNAASKGLLNSGATAKALQGYGQGLAGQTFNNYLGQLGSLNNQAQSTANAGVGATTAVGTAGTSGGTAAGSSTGTGTQSFFNSLGTAASLFI